MAKLHPVCQWLIGQPIDLDRTVVRLSSGPVPLARFVEEHLAHPAVLDSLQALIEYDTPIALPDGSEAHRGVVVRRAPHRYVAHEDDEINRKIKDHREGY